MTYRIEFVKQAAKQLKALSSEEQQKIKIKLMLLPMFLVPMVWSI